jgi:nucleotide-binding universal stress UspA family protein
VTATAGSFRRILVPVDFSTRSANALTFAVALGSLQHAEIDVLHVWHSDLRVGVTVAKERAKNALREFVASLELQGDVSLRRRIDHGDRYLTIQRVAQLAGHDLIVVAGPESQHASEDSVAKALLSSAPSAVLFVPPGSRARWRSDDDRTLSLESVLVPLALAGEELEALDCAEALTSEGRATVEVLTTSDASPNCRARLKARAPLARREEREVAELSVPAVAKRAQASFVDLVVLCGQRSPIGARPGDDRAERVALSHPSPTLCLPR